MLAASAPRFETGEAPRVAALGLALLGAGALAVLAPAALVLLLLAAVAMLRGQRLFQDSLMFLLGGSLVLTYGFSNLGMNFGRFPTPLAEIILIPLAGWCILHGKSLRSIGLPLAFVAMFIALASLRLIADFADHGTLAVRDFTLAVEVLILLIGFWAVNEYGVAWASRLFQLVFLAVVLYWITYPWGPTLGAMGPTVGLQQPVPLLGLYDSTGPAVAAALIFFLVTLRLPWSVLLGAACLAELAILQLRGLYLAVPLALVVTLLASGRVPTRVPSRMLLSVVVAATLLFLVAPLIPSGRLGPVTASFTTAQLGTLFGKEGPGEGSYDIRAKWLDATVERLRENTGRLVWGMGLGPDLASGFTTGSDVFVRKPHNDHLEILARLGFLGLTLWVGLLASTLIPVWRATRARNLLPEERTFLTWSLPGIAIYLLIAATQPILAYPHGTVPLFLLIGMSLALARRVERRALEEGAP